MDAEAPAQEGAAYSRQTETTHQFIDIQPCDILIPASQSKHIIPTRILKFGTILGNFLIGLPPLHTFLLAVTSSDVSLHKFTLMWVLTVAHNEAK